MMRALPTKLQIHWNLSNNHHHQCQAGGEEGGKESGAVVGGNRGGGAGALRFHRKLKLALSLSLSDRLLHCVPPTLHWQHL